MRVHRALRLSSTVRRGSSRPMVVETSAGLFLVKLRGAAQGTAPLVAEVIVAELADALGLAVPRRVLVSIDRETECVDRDPEVTELLAASQGRNLGFRYLEGAREVRPHEAVDQSDDLACRVLWLDALVMNPDRTRRNPNILIHEKRPWLIDHGACLPFQYDWRRVREDSPRSRGYPVGGHLFGDRAGRVAEWDARLAARLSREVLRAAVAQVPDDFLAPLLAAGSRPDIRLRRRLAYEAFLWKRLKAPRPFIGS